MLSVLLLACARGTVCGGSVTDYDVLFNDRVEITFTGAPPEGDRLSEFPLLVQLSEGSPEGFSYARVDPEGQDIRFAFVEGATSNAVPYEVDTWNTNGVSSLWVRVPNYSDKSDLKLVMYWAPDDPDTLPENDSREVWNGYTAVWHLNGTAAESSTNRIAASVGAAATAQEGVIGSALGTRASGANGPILLVPSGTPVDALSRGAYTISCWLRANLLSGSPWLYSARATQEESAFGAELLSDSGVRLKLHADAAASDTTAKSFDVQKWVHLAVVHDGSNDLRRVYLNGAEFDFDSPAEKRADAPGAGGFAFGGLVGASASGTLNGDLDDVRIYAGALGQSRITNEYAQAVSPSRLAFSNFHSTGKPVYPEDPEPEPEPTPEPTTGDMSPDDYAGRAVFIPTVTDEALTNFVTLIKVWEGEPSGFVPRDLPFGKDDIRFFDQDGNVLNYEIEVWDVDNESSFWVSVPCLDSKTRITMCWGLKAGRALPANDPKAVWSNYAGVWHMTDATDSTTNAAFGVLGESAITNLYGLAGRAFGTTKSGQNGAILDVEATRALDSLTNGPFTVSGWVWLNRKGVRSGALFSRATSEEAAWGAQFCGGTSGDNTKIEVQAGSSSFQTDVTVTPLSWVRFDFVYAADRLACYIGGEFVGESAAARSVLNGTSGQLAIGGFVSAAEGVLGANTLDGYIDEFRIRSGVPSADELSVDTEQCRNDRFYTRQPASWDSTVTLQNRWRVYPTASKTDWNEGDEPAAFTLGTPWYGTSQLSYQNRATGEALAEMPTEPGDYRAVFYCEATGRYSDLTYTIAFRIRQYRPTHDLGSGNERILLLNGDQSVSDGKVYTEAYDDTIRSADRPYWVHDVDSGDDYTSASPYYNFCGGLRHTYYARGRGRTRTRLWDLVDVRYGNTYNNADDVLTRTGDWEEWDDGLADDMNYLPWNPKGGRLIDDGGALAEGWHEFAAQAVLCNTTKASVNSTLYTNGIGTVYFDCVNSHTDDATNGYYKLVVEIATNALDRTTGLPYGVPTDGNIAATHTEWDDERGYVTVVHDSYKYADWKPLTLHVNLVRGTDVEDLGTTDELVLDRTGGGSYTNFYRIYAPFNFSGKARFRIRRSAINPAYTIATDVHSLILVDNVICSAPTERFYLEPRGIYDTTKVRRETIGYEGAFTPSYPSVGDTAVYARARATDAAGREVSTEFLSSAMMHYRWRYLDQQVTDWMTVDLVPSTLVSQEPLAWTGLSGDIEYWYEGNVSSLFYQYVDYSGAGAGLPGYSEEVSAVQGRAPTYATLGKDWFTRIRDGKSSYATVKLFVKRGTSTKVESVEMFVARDRIWRGCLLATNAVAGGISFRLEGRNGQDDSQADFQFNTNFWYLAESVEKLPVTGFVVAGATNDWGAIPCDGATGHILFQFDETTRALTVVHADWQDFNGWNDAHKDYFSGSSTDDVTKRGVSAGASEYLCYASQWDDDVATNAFWIERFRLASYAGYDFYAPFTSERSPNGFDVGEGMWVRGAYADTSDESGMALQMAGQGRGHIQMTDPTVRPRGLESVRFSARIAQTVSPGDFAYCETDSRLKDYSFLTRVAFDRNANSNFTGNASLSLAAFYRPNTSCYEARWEQLTGNIESNSCMILGPSPRGQRLVLYRWKYEDRDWKATELYAATNAGSVYSWGANRSPRAIPVSHSITNGLMPFMIGAYDNEDEDYTVVVAAVHIEGDTDAAKNIVGNTASATMSYLGSQRGWFYVVYRDTGADRLTRGTYGTLAANCEGIFVHPQLHEGIVSWDSKTKTRTLDTQVYPTASVSYGAIASFYDSAGAKDCVEDLADDCWIVPSGRMRSFYEEDGSGFYTDYNGFTYASVTQTVNVLTAPYGTETWTNVASRTLEGFGRPGALQDVEIDVWSTDDAAVRIQSGGTIRNVRTDVVVDNIQISQWRGQNWLGRTASERAQGGPTNFVYTSGWITDGALQLSPRRTPDGTPCSLRGPLCDGQGSSASKRGSGLGMLRIKYRNAQSNACLLVQVATNGLNALTLLDRTLDAGTDPSAWTTVTNWNFAAMSDEARADGILECTPGLHGVVGTMRVIVDPALRAKVKSATDPTAFGSVEIVEALFRDEPALDKGCWWGFNIRTIGDVSDEEKKMYLPDNPMRSLSPHTDEIGRSLALNNSITADCDPSEVAKSPNPFREHMPFVQTPTFTSNVVGEVSFRARKWPLQKGAQHAEVTLFGTSAADVDKLNDEDWEELNVFIVSNTTYETYTFKTETSAGYRAFRLAVTGVSGVSYPGHQPVCGKEPVRVLIDDVLVSEAIRARLAFRNVGAFRHHISETTYVPNVPSAYEQPICGEGWGIQAEIYSAMLGEEVDTSYTPRVRLHYYKGVSPWGFSQWRSKGTRAWLTLASDTNGVYRSSTTASPDAVIPMSNSGEYVQYMLEVVYKVVNSETGGRSFATNWLESADWQVPSWYYPVDLNATYGAGRTDRFAAFAIIDAIAPGWAWINEINLFGEFNSAFRNSDRNKQFVEVVKPTDYDLDNWELKMLSAKNYGTSRTDFITNTVAVFGKNGLPKQKAGTDRCSYMSFIVVGNPTTTLKSPQYDGSWHFGTTDNKVFNSDGELGSYYPVAMQLVRPSGVIEHEVAILGTNAFQSVATSIAWQYSSTNVVRLLKANAPNSAVFALPDDNPPLYVKGVVTNSVGVFQEKGRSALCWNNTMKMTPGDLNENQYIDPNVPHPGGELIMVFASVDTSFGRIWQTVGAGTNTTQMQTLILDSNSASGTNITYTVAPWCELGSVKETEDGAARTPVVVLATNRQYTVNVAKGAKGNVTVVASAQVDSRLRGYGLDGKNRYTPAVLHWLEHHKDVDGNDFYSWRDGSTNDTIHLAKFLSLSGREERDMTLTEMYWLDMDPTASNMFFRAGMVRPPSQIVVKQPTYDPQGDPPSVTNLRMGVYMSISNGNGHASHRGKSVWAPYVLRGLGEGEISWNYSPSSASSGAWTSETFKVTGFMNNGDTNPKDADAWVPLRYFVFAEGSFDANFESEIDVTDPYSTQSPAYAQGWNRWVVEHGGVKPPVYMSWSIDTRLQPITAEILAPTNRLDGTGK